MPRIPLLAALVLALSLLVAPRAEAQGATDWRPPGRAMPMMPLMAELSGDWLGPRAAWFRGTEGISGIAVSQLRPMGEKGAGDHAQVVRFNGGPIPAVVWSDRNGDNRADMIEIFRTGGVIIQVIDADFDGQANVLRVYDASGRLLREERL
jgi:hypothetical protein